MTLDRRDIDHIFQKLREGVVPERGIEAFAVGVEQRRNEIGRMLDFVRDGEGSVKFLRGGYGCGKTFMARLAQHDAQARGFVTSFVVVSDNDLHLHRFEEVYRKIMAGLSTADCPGGNALGDILDRWIGAVEEKLLDLGHDEDADDFPTRVRDRLEAELARLSGSSVPADFVRGVQTVFDLKEAGDLADAGLLLGWLAGSTKVAASVKRRADLKGELTSGDALAWLRGVLEICKAAGYRGLTVVVDEAETILRMRKDVRGKSLNGIRQIVDGAGAMPGLLWIFTGTPEFFDSEYGVKGLAPLHDRIRFNEKGGFASLRQPQLQLEPFKRERLIRVAQKLRDLHPTNDRSRLERLAGDRFLDRLVETVTAGFKGDVGVVPRQFLREWVDVLDLIETRPDYEPSVAYEFKPKDLNDVEQHVLAGQRYASAPSGTPEPVPVEEVW